MQRKVGGAEPEDEIRTGAAQGAGRIIRKSRGKYRKSPLNPLESEDFWSE